MSVYIIGFILLIAYDVYTSFLRRYFHKDANNSGILKTIENKLPLVEYQTYVSISAYCIDVGIDSVDYCKELLSKNNINNYEVYYEELEGLNGVCCFDKEIKLSDNFKGTNSLSGMCVAAHEVSHAIDGKNISMLWIEAIIKGLLELRWFLISLSLANSTYFHIGIFLLISLLITTQELIKCPLREWRAEKFSRKTLKKEDIYKIKWVEEYLEKGIDEKYHFLRKLRDKTPIYLMQNIFLLIVSLVVSLIIVFK